MVCNNLSCIHFVDLARPSQSIEITHVMTAYNCATQLSSVSKRDQKRSGEPVLKVSCIWNHPLIWSCFHISEGIIIDRLYYIQRCVTFSSFYSSIQNGWENTRTDIPWVERGPHRTIWSILIISWCILSSYFVHNLYSSRGVYAVCGLNLTPSPTCFLYAESLSFLASVNI